MSTTRKNNLLHKHIVSVCTKMNSILLDGKGIKKKKEVAKGVKEQRGLRKSQRQTHLEYWKNLIVDESRTHLETHMLR